MSASPTDLVAAERSGVVGGLSVSRVLSSAISTTSLTAQRWDGAAFVSAQAISSANTNSCSSVLLSDSVRISSGRISFPAHGFTVGSKLFLSQTVAGVLTATEPTSGVIQEIGFVESSSSIYINVQNPRNPQIYRTTANVTSTSTTIAAVTGLVFTGVVGRSYNVQFSGNFQTVATGTGAILGLTGTGNGLFAGYWEGSIASTSVATARSIPIASKSTIFSTPSVDIINTPQYAIANFVYHCTTAGTLQIGFATEVAASQATLLNGASLIVQEF